MKITRQIDSKDKLLLVTVLELGGSCETRTLLKAIRHLKMMEFPRDHYLQFITGIQRLPKEVIDYITDVECYRILRGFDYLNLAHINQAGDKVISVQLTEEGQHLAQLIAAGRKPEIRLPRPERNTIFVASAFGHDEIDLLYERDLKPACEVFGYEPFRVDLTEPERTITEAILTAIGAGECVVADLTYARPSVYFEVGYAHGMGIPLVLTCREDHHHGLEDNAKVHFDLQQYKISYWTKHEDNFKWQNNMSPSERLALVIEPRKAED